MNKLNEINAVKWRIEYIVTASCEEIGWIPRGGVLRGPGSESFMPDSLGWADLVVLDNIINH